MSGVTEAFAQAWASMRRSGRSAIMSIGTITIAFLAFGGFLLVSRNLESMVDRWKEAAELSVYLQDTIDDKARLAVEALLKSHAAVAAVEYVSRPAARDRFRADFPELADVAGSPSENPFPASFEVRLKPGTAAADAGDTLAAELKGHPGVAEVRSDRRWLARVLSLVAIARVGGSVVAGVLLIGAAFTVAAVVRLSLHARRDEVEIMQLVGAPFSLIRGPFIAEGMLLGGIGAATAFVALWLGQTYLLRSLGPDIAGLFGDGGARVLGVREALLVLVSGFAVGGASGAVASRAAR
jgi:cell division transport system permease protein